MHVSLDEMSITAKTIVENLRPFVGQAHIVALSGNLGAGKTTLTQHIAQELGIEEQITSPTFVLMKQYLLTGRVFSQLVHIDAYRLESPDELNPLRVDELFSNPENLILIEWPERVLEKLPVNRTNISLTVVDDTSRDITITYAKEN
jgi:tRNA threonylcarbamoyladenosine biosynthesis protein TsaE